MRRRASTTARLLDTAHAAALALWLAVILGAGASAAVLFPQMRDLEPTLAAFAAYEGPHWRLAAGRVANTIFHLGDTAQIIIALAALLTAARAFAFAARRRATGVLAALALLTAFILLGVQRLSLRPAMDRALDAYWAAAAAGDTETALAHQQTFAAMHPTASNLIVGTAVAVGASLLLHAWSLTAREDAHRSA